MIFFPFQFFFVVITWEITLQIRVQMVTIYIGTSKLQNSASKISALISLISTSHELSTFIFSSVMYRTY